MRLARIQEAWPTYSARFPGVPEPPESIFIVADDGEFEAGCCIYPAAMMMVVTGMVGSPRGLKFLLKVLRAHEQVTHRVAFIQPVEGTGLAGLPLGPANLMMLVDEVPPAGDTGSGRGESAEEADQQPPPAKTTSKPRARQKRGRKKP